MAELKKAHKETPWWARAAVLALFAAIGFGVIVMLNLANEVKGYSTQNRDNAVATCQQGNVNRKADLQNLRGDIKRLRGTAAAERADLAGLRRSGVTDPEWLGAHQTNLDGIVFNIGQKERAIRRKLASIEPYSAREGTAFKDCQAANPLPPGRGISISIPIPFTG